MFRGSMSQNPIINTLLHFINNLYKKIIIFGKFLSQTFIKIFSKTHQIAINIFSGEHPLKPLVLRHKIRAN